MKYYRYFISRRHLRETRYNQVKIIRLPFFGFVLFELSAFRLGSNVNISYGYVTRHKSLFGLRPYLKQIGVIKNLYRNRRNFEKLSNNWPEELKKHIKVIKFIN